METVQSLATKYLKHFKLSKRDNGKSFYHLKDKSPQALKDLVQSAHDKMFPDCYKYEYVHDALLILSESESPEDAISEIEPDCYTNDLLSWVSSHHERVGYVDEQAEELGHSDNGIIGDIMQGQVFERTEIATRLLNSLQALVDDIAA